MIVSVNKAYFSHLPVYISAQGSAHRVDEVVVAQKKNWELCALRNWDHDCAKQQT